MYRVAIIGRPNVGKSTLFNRLTSTRKAIVGDEPGITRDRLHQVAHWDQKRFEVIDTGGMIPHQRELIPKKVLEQAEIAIGQAHLILFVVDVRSGITPLDEALNSLLRSRDKEHLLVVNKVDVPRFEEDALQFYALGAKTLFSISAEHKEGVFDLLEEILKRVPESGGEVQHGEIGVAIIGRPNVGKSSLLNRFLGEERAIVTVLPGTTRDAVDTLFRFKGQRYRLIDTAGIRRKGKTERKTEKLSVIMARKSLERADVVLLILDAVEGVTKLDATIGGYAQKAGKSIILVVNKWDLVDRGASCRQLEKAFRTELRFLDYAPLMVVSAETGYHVFRVLDQVDQAHRARSRRVPTAELNQFFKKHLQALLPAAGNLRKFPVKYAVQVGIEPPTFVLFTRQGRKLHFSKERYLVNQLRRRYLFYATPIRILSRSRGKTLKT